MKPFWGNRVLLLLTTCLTLSWPTAAQTSPYKPTDILPPAKRAAMVKIKEGPALESVRNDEAIIRWTSTNPGGSDQHFGVVHYGTDPAHLTEVAKSPIRLNQNHPDTVFRVRVEGLKPGTKYYYMVDSMQATGESDGVKSPVAHFSTP